jgi:hypothetical protein
MRSSPSGLLMQPKLAFAIQKNFAPGRLKTSRSRAILQRTLLLLGELRHRKYQISLGRRLGMVLADDRRPSHDRLISSHSRLALSRFSTRQNKAPHLDRGRTVNRGGKRDRRNADEDCGSRRQSASGSCIGRCASRLTLSGMCAARTPKSTSRILGGS